MEGRRGKMGRRLYFHFKEAPLRRILIFGLLCLLLCPSVSKSLSAEPKPAPVWALAFRPDGTPLAAGTYQRVQLWDVAAKTASRALTGAVGPVRCLAWSADGKQLAAGCGKPAELGQALVWSVAEDGTAAAPTMLKEHKDVVEGVAFAPAADTLVTAGMDEKAIATQWSTGKVVRTMTDHTNRVVSVSVSPNGKWVATGSLDKTVKIWDATDFKPLANLDNNNGQVYAVRFLPPGNQLVVAGEDGNVRIYQLSESRTGKLSGVNGNVVRTFNGNRTPVFALAVSQKGDLLAYAGEDKTVHVQDLSGGKRRYTLNESPDAVYALAFSPDGSLLAAGCRDGKVRLWTTADGKPAGEL
jgi:WD40 repeat protein